jgi:hypothetical protein
MRKFFLALLSVVFCSVAFAQVQDPNSPGFDLNTGDSSQLQSTDGSGEPQPEEVVVKPYERIVLYVDSVTNLISYLGVVEQEESGSDSLYARAKRWALKKFATSGKAVFATDKKNQKLIINCVLPAYSYSNKYNKRDIGKYEFKMTVWIKEGRYKYQVSNFVHESVKPAQGDATRNYFEYYYTSITNIKGNDLTLRYADKDINALITEFKKVMKDPVIVDEEDW